MMAVFPDIRRYGGLCLLGLCLALMPVQAALSSTNDGLPFARGEIIRDVARLTFEWPQAVDFKFAVRGSSVFITFDRPSNPDAGAILASLYPYITHIERRPDGRTIMLALDKAYKIRKFMSNNVSGIEILGIDPRGRATQLAASGGKERSAQELSLLAPAAGEMETPPPTEPKPVKPEAQDDGAAQPGPADIPVQINKVTVSVADDSATLRFPLAERTAFAVFKRNHHLWIILGRPVKLDLSEFNDIEKTVIGKPEVISHKKATILYIPIDGNVYASLAKEDNSDRVAILITQKRQVPAFPLSVEISTTPPAPPHVLIPTLEMSDTIVVRDPVIGDKLLVTPLFKSGEGVANAREFIDFDLLGTVQGIAVAKKADDVTVVQLRNGIRVTTAKGAIISQGLPKLDIKDVNDSVQANPTLFPYEMWKADSSRPRRKQLQQLFHQIVEAENNQDANNARLRMAQIYLSEGLAPEAIAMLDGINRSNPSFYRIAKLNALRGAANFLMTRFIESAKDFSAVELNNNKEIEYWRAVLSDLLGNTSQTYDYLAMNEDYISKYPAFFRQRLAIVAADRAISAKDYNIALKIFDSLHQDNLLDSINVYINFLMAKIALDTGQEKEAAGNLEKIASDVKHPFVMARAEFTLIARDMEEGVDTEKTIDRLERLRLDWHGDNLELKVLTLLGELYHDKKDYVNAMRVWNNGIQSFPNTTTAMDMARKMSEAFIVMFNEGEADKLPPLEALALYYEYRNYMPSGTAGSEMLERLADRLISVDLLDQTAGLLEHQMRNQSEKERRSHIGAKLASVHLMNRQPQKALNALQDSVYGENPVMLRLLRNQLSAEAMVGLGKPDLALQTLGQDESPEAERIRINIYWQAKDWAKLSASVEYMLKKRQDITAPVTLDESEYLIKLALAYIFTNNKEQLQYLRDYFGPLMAKSPNRKVFEFVTSSDVIPNSRNFDEIIRYFDDTSAFISNYQARIKIAGTNPASAKN